MEILIKELDLPNDEEHERLRIELYKTLQSMAPNIKIEDKAISLSIMGMQSVLEKYGYSLAYNEIVIPIVRKSTPYVVPSMPKETRNERY